jgi:quercetin dioxygenase-like cupin family protein
MSSRTLSVGVVALSLLPACHSAMHAEEPQAGRAPFAALASGQVRRTLLGSGPATDQAGWETRLYLIEYGPGAVAPLHIHPVVGVGYVLEGSFESAFEGEQPVVVKTGERFADRAGVAHRLFRNLSDSRPLRFVIAYTIRPAQQIVYPGGALPAN